MKVIKNKRLNRKIYLVGDLQQYAPNNSYNVKVLKTSQ